MISGKDIYNILAALVPLYVAMILAYASVRWWRIFTPDQCSGISRFVSIFAIPFLAFNIIASNNVYSMNFRFIAADSLQKIVILAALFLWNTFMKRGSLEWMITIFSLSTMPNVIIVGVPMLKSMYGDFSANLMVQIIVIQFVIWNNVILFMFEYRASKLLISDQFYKTTKSNTSIKDGADVVLPVGIEPSEADSHIKSCSNSMTSRPSNPTEVDIYSFDSTQNIGCGCDDSKGARECVSNISKGNLRHEVNSGACADIVCIDLCEVAPSDGAISKADDKVCGEMGLEKEEKPNSSRNGSEHMENMELEKEEGTKPFRSGSELMEKKDISANQKDISADQKQQIPPTIVTTKHIPIMMIGRKLMRNPNTYASFLGLAWSLISYRWHIQMPTIVKGSITILSSGSLGLVMFNLGLFMASQPKIIACEKSLAALSMAVKFLAGPAVMAATSAVMGIRGVFLQVAIIQAALPLAFISFIFAKEYNVHAEILSTGVIFGMLIALPIVLLYYILLGL